MDTQISFKSILIAGMCSLFALLFFGIFTYLNDVPKVVFCDVGQGDGAYIRLSGGIDIVIDAGPPNSISSCLGKYIPFYDRTIELALVSHPQLDHYGGFISIIAHYKVERFLMSLTKSDSLTFLSFLKQIKDNDIPIEKVFTGERIQINDATLSFLWPSQTTVAHAVAHHLDPNLASQIILFEKGSTRILFTGDFEFSNDPIDLPLPNGRWTGLTILKTPHHGSKNGLSEQLLQQLKPNIAVISVGKNNSYGHPNKEIIEMLKKYGVETHRTDQEGDVEYRL